MTSDVENIGKYIKDIARSEMNTFSVLGYVVSVDEKGMVCTVQAADNSAVYYNVRLKEITKKDEIENGFWLIPEEKSRVIIDCIAPSEAYVSMVSEVKKVHFRVNKKRVGLSDAGFSLDEEEGEDLKTLIDELFDFLKAGYKVQTAWGPSGFATPDAGAEIDNLKGRFSKLFTEGNNNAIA